MRSKTRNIAVYAMVVVLAVVLVSTMGLSVFSGVSLAANNESAPVEIGKIAVGHMSDIHYFPLEHCYKDVYASNYKASDFYYSMTGDTKLVLESGLALNAQIQQIIKDGHAGTAPMYLVTSGDLSKNGERAALIDVANSLRYLQNEMRKIGGYENFQVFATVGNHDLYNHNGSLYSQDDGSARPSDMVTATQFALIFAGLGFPNVSYSTLKAYFDDDSYWGSEYTKSTQYPTGYVASENKSAIEISYYSEALTESLTKSEPSEILQCYFNIGNELNQLTYFASLTGDSAGYSFAVMDSTDREATDHGALVRISQAEYNAMPAEEKPSLYLYDVNNGHADAEADLNQVVSSDTAFGQSEKAVYRRTPVQHITGGRVTEACLNWVEKMANAKNAANATAGSYEETIISVAHHNALPHFEQEDDILKDFTLYNWEYDVNRLLKMGVRYMLSGHMHASDAMTYTDVEGRTFYDFQTGSTISYSSPRRYVTFSRNDCDGALGEQLISQVHLLGDITKIASTHITAHTYNNNTGTLTDPWKDAEYQSAIAAYKSIGEEDVAERNAAWQEVINTNPDYLTFIIRYEEFALLTDNFDEEQLPTLYNSFITSDIYGILVKRIVDHFITQSTIDGLLESVHTLILGLDNYSSLSTVGIVLSLLGVDGKTLDIAATYMIDTILNNLYGEDGYVYEGVKYDTALDYLLAIINHLLDLEFGDDTVGTEASNPNKGNVGKLKLRDIASFIMMSHATGNEISLSETYESIDEKFGANDHNYGEIIDNDNPDNIDIRRYRYTQPDNPVYRKRMLAAVKDLSAKLVSGEFVQTLLDTLLDPLFNDEDSLIKTLLDYKFDFREADWENAAQYKKIENLFKNKLNNIINNQQIDIKSLLAEFAGITLPDDFTLTYNATAVSLNDILKDILPIAKPFLGNFLGFNIEGNNVVEILGNFIDSYVTDSFLKGIGGIANEIVIAYATDVYPDMSYETYNPAEDYEVTPNAKYTYGGKSMSYVSSKNVVSTVGAAFNAATQDNGRVPSRVTANFDTINGTTAYTVKFYTAEDVYGTFKYKTSENGAWTSVSTSKANADKNKDYFDSETTHTDASGIKVTMLTQTKPVYLPLIDLGLLCVTHAEVDYDIDKNNKDVPYKYGERDNAPKNSIVYWNVTTVTVTGLSPDTTYYYDLEGNYENGNVKAGFSLVDFVKHPDNGYNYNKDYFTFTTAKDSSADKFEFLTIADIQGMIQSMYSNSWKAVEALLANDDTKNFDFILNAGDMCDNGKNFNQWAYALNTYQTLFANTSMFFAAGNHEKGSNALTNFFNYTLNSPQEDTTVDGLYYSFDYGNAHFVVLNTNDASSSGLGSKQYSWLENNLKNSNAKWKFVLMHKSIYSGGSHSTDSEVVAMRTQLQKLFAETGVSIVFGGHDHTYTTTYLVDKNGNAIDKTDDSEIKYTKGGGVLYITLGTMGTKFYEYKENGDIIGNFDNDKSILETLTSQTFGKVVVDGDIITYTGYQYQYDEQTKTGSLVKLGENKLTPAPQKAGNGLSLGAIIGISVAAAVVVLGAVTAVVVVLVVKKQKEIKRQKELELRKKKIAALKRAKALQALKAAQAAQAAEKAKAESATEEASSEEAPSSPEQPTEQPEE